MDLPEIQQPLPQRSFLSSRFHSSSGNSEDTTSTKAQVGVLKPDVPASLMRRNEARWGFVGGAEQSQSASGLEPSDCKAPPVQREISPGVSQFGLPKIIGDASEEGDLVEMPAPADTSDGHLRPSVQRQENILQAHELDASILGVSGNSDILPVYDQTISSSTWSWSFQPMEIWKTGKHVAPAHQIDLLDTNQVSMQVIPDSGNPALEELLSQPHTYTNFRNHIDDKVVPFTLPEPHLPESDQELWKLPHLQEDAVTDQEQLLKPPSTKRDRSDMWKEFVLGDYDNNIKEVLEEARKETARNLQPSHLHTSICEDGHSDFSSLYPATSGTTVALHSGPSVKGPDSSKQYDSSSTELSSTAPDSRMATFGCSSSDPLSGPDPTDSYIGATVGESSSDLPYAPDSANVFTRATFGSSPDPPCAPALTY